MIDLKSIDGFDKRRKQAVIAKEEHQKTDECTHTPDCPICKEYDIDIMLSNPDLP